MSENDENAFIKRTREAINSAMKEYIETSSEIMYNEREAKHETFRNTPVFEAMGLENPFTGIRKLVEESKCKN